MRLTPADLDRILRTSDVTLVTDGAYTTAEPSPVAAALVQVGINSEHDLQTAVMAECERRALTQPEYGLLFAIPNGQYRPGQRMEAGLKDGVLDLFWPVPIGQHHGLFIELKWKKNKPKPKQLEWARRLRNRGYRVEFIWDSVAAVMAVMEDYLGGG